MSANSPKSSATKRTKHIPCVGYLLSKGGRPKLKAGSVVPWNSSTTQTKVAIRRGYIIYLNVRVGNNTQNLDLKKCSYQALGGRTDPSFVCSSTWSLGCCRLASSTKPLPMSVITMNIIITHPQ